MENNRKVPNIRFAGFTDTWEQRKLGDVLKESPEISPDKPENHELLTVKLHFQGVVASGEKPKPTKRGRPYYFRNKGELIIGRQNFHNGGFGIVDSNTDGLIASNAIQSFDAKGVNIYFLLNYMQRKDWLERTEIYVGGTGQKEYSVKTLKNLHILIPNKDEENKIAIFFKELDNLFTLHQREYDLLVKTKKSYLRKMFPQKGEDKPEIRFTGFTDAWEQRRLGELVDVRSGRDYKHLSDGDIPVYGTGGYMLSVNEALSYSEDAIGIGRKGTIDKPYLLKAPFWTVDTLFYAVPRDGYELNFVYNIFQNIEWKKKDESTGVPSLSKTAINEIRVLTPRYNEQKIIGGYFSQLDNIITLHQRELNSLKNMKKSLLQQMFV